LVVVVVRVKVHNEEQIQLLFLCHIR
jgi:hypothetical protein